MSSTTSFLNWVINYVKLGKMIKYLLLLFLFEVPIHVQSTMSLWSDKNVHFRTGTLVYSVNV